MLFPPFLLCHMFYSEQLLNQFIYIYNQTLFVKETGLIFIFHYHQYLIL